VLVEEGVVVDTLVMVRELRVEDLLVLMVV
jgi:hypothetical protein